MARIPLYKQAEDEMRRRIAEGDWQPGLRLGNEFELAAEFGVSQGTMRRALMTLEAEGYLLRKPGRGTLVADASAKVPANGPGTGQLQTRDGLPPDLQLYRAKSTSRSPDLSEARLFGPSQVTVIERVLNRGDDRAALEVLTIPTALVPDLQEAAGPELQAFLSAHGLAATRTETRLSTRITTMSESVTLACDRNTALLVLNRLAYGQDGKALARQKLLVADPDLEFAA